jgi:hypothetical protein
MQNLVTHEESKHQIPAEKRIFCGNFQQISDSMAVALILPGKSGKENVS